MVLSSGGPGTGKFWTSIPRGRSQFFSVDHFATALRLRLADYNIEKGATCQMHLGKADDERIESIRQMAKETIKTIREMKEGEGSFNGWGDRVAQETRGGGHRIKRGVGSLR